MLEKIEKLADDYINFIRQYLVVFILIIALLSIFTNLPIWVTLIIFVLGYVVFYLKNKIKPFRGN